MIQFFATLLHNARKIQARIPFSSILNTIKNFVANVCKALYKYVRVDGFGRFMTEERRTLYIFV